MRQPYLAAESGSVRYRTLLTERLIATVGVSTHGYSFAATALTAPKAEGYTPTNRDDGRTAMGFLDDVLGSSVPNGNVSKPLIIALGALLASGALFKHSAAVAAPSRPGSQPDAPPPAGSAAGGILGGLGGLMTRFQQGGLGDVMKSWVGSGQNQPISSDQLASVLGPEVMQTLAQKTGLSQQDLAAHLSQVLPRVVDKLTPNGRLPTPSEAGSTS